MGAVQQLHLMDSQLDPLQNFGPSATTLL